MDVSYTIQACPRSLYVFAVTMSKTFPNGENTACSAARNSVKENVRIEPLTHSWYSVRWRTRMLTFLHTSYLASELFRSSCSHTRCGILRRLVTPSQYLSFKVEPAAPCDVLNIPVYTCVAKVSWFFRSRRCANWGEHCWVCRFVDLPQWLWCILRNVLSRYVYLWTWNAYIFIGRYERSRSEVARISATRTRQGTTSTRAAQRTIAAHFI